MRARDSRASCRSRFPPLPAPYWVRPCARGAQRCGRRPAQSRAVPAVFRRRCRRGMRVAPAPHRGLTSPPAAGCAGRLPPIRAAARTASVRAFRAWRDGAARYSPKASAPASTPAHCPTPPRVRAMRGRPMWQEVFRWRKGGGVAPSGRSTPHPQRPPLYPKPSPAPWPSARQSAPDAQRRTVPAHPDPINPHSPDAAPPRAR